MATKQMSVTVVRQQITDDDLKRLAPTPIAKSKCTKCTLTFPNPETSGRTTLFGQFKVFDGFAYGTCNANGKEREVFVQFPLEAFINKNAAAKSLKEKIKNHLSIEEDRDVTNLEIFISYGQFRLLN